MNELITLLALRASDPKTGWLDRQKFAELIIRECADVANDHNSEVEGVTLGVGRALKKHFGVE